jgi:hypothetical protein
MCLEQAQYPISLKVDTYMWKIFILTPSGTLYSPYRYRKYRYGVTTRTVSMRRILKTGRYNKQYIVEQGYHGFVHYQQARSAASSLVCYHRRACDKMIVLKVLIPAGTKMYKGVYRDRPAITAGKIKLPPKP